MKKIFRYIIASIGLTGTLGLNSCSDFWKKPIKIRLLQTSFTKLPKEWKGSLIIAPTRIWYGKVIGHLLTKQEQTKCFGGFTGYTYFHDYSSLYKQQKRAFYLFGKAFIEVSMLVIQHWNIFRHRLFQLVKSRS
jgi:hypothetical protein